MFDGPEKRLHAFSNGPGKGLCSVGNFIDFLCSAIKGQVIDCVCMGSLSSPPLIMFNLCGVCAGYFDVIHLACFLFLGGIC